MFGAIETERDVQGTKFKFIVAVGEVTKNSRNAFLHSFDSFDLESDLGVRVEKIAASKTTGLLSCASKFYYANENSLVDFMVAGVDGSMYDAPTKLVTFDTIEQFNDYLHQHEVRRIPGANKKPASRDTLVIKKGQNYTMRDLVSAATILAASTSDRNSLGQLNVPQISAADVKVVVDEGKDSKSEFTLTKAQRIALLQSLVDAYKIQFLTYQAERFKHHTHFKIDRVLDHVNIEE